MNAVEIEEAISKLAGEPFDPAAFPFAFLEAFGNKATTINRLKSGSSNTSDIEGGVLQRNNIHIAVASAGTVTKKLAELKASPKTAAAKAKFILATDGTTLEAEDLASGETVACAYPDFANHFGFFLPLAGITTVKQIRNNPVDIQATGRLNRLYVELLRENEDWAREERRHDLNQFMARLIFCFFAEDTGIFYGERTFTKTIEQMSDSRSGNTHEVIGELFRAMDTKIADRKAANFRPWAEVFPYVNGGLFKDTKDVPRFSRIARSYLLHAGSLDWKQINPDIFGSMIQAVAHDEERGELGMHYTSVPNILKVLNPLFLDDLREQLEQAGDNPRKLLNLRRRIASIRVFDPACGSGNFLVIAYIQMREIEAEIIRRRREEKKKSWIKLSSFYGIELKDFAAEVARLALLIAEFQCDVRLIGQQDALLDVLPLKRTGQIYTGNALHLDWLKVCPPAVQMERQPTDLFDTESEQPEIDFEAKEVETFICGNPPYKGGTEQGKSQKLDMEKVFGGRSNSWKSLDYVAGWFLKFADYAEIVQSACAFVSTNSICQGEQVARLWPMVQSKGIEIFFAHTSFKWANLASHNAGVTVAIVGLRRDAIKQRKIFSIDDDGVVVARNVSHINPYLVPAPNVVVEAASQSMNGCFRMDNGNKPADGGFLSFGSEALDQMNLSLEQARKFVRPFVGSKEAINGLQRFCIWIDSKDVHAASKIPAIASRIEGVVSMREASDKALTKSGAATPYSFQQIRQLGDEIPLIVPRHSSESRPYLPISLHRIGTIVSDSAFAFYDAPLWNMAIVASRIHLVWIATVCGKIKKDFRYSNTLGWNTFPVPPLTEKNKADLTRCAEDILLAREAHFPATIADLYDPEAMPEDLRRVHDRNDETLERIYIGRRFKNDTERLEKLFDLYTKMTAGKGAGKKEGVLTMAAKSVPSVSVTYARTGASTKANEFGMRVMQERAFEKRGEQYLLIKSPPASGKSRALMFIALDKLHNQGIKQAIIVVPERSIGGSFADEPLANFGFHWDWEVKPQWNLCNAPGIDEPRVAKSKVKAVAEFLASPDRILVCTHATFRFAVDELGVEAFDNRLIAVDEFHHVSASPDNKLGAHLGAFIARDKVHLVAMTGSYFRGDAVAVLAPEDEAKFETVTYTYYEQLNGYDYLKSLDIGYYFYSGSYVDDILKVLEPSEKTILHIPNVNSRESTKQKLVEVELIMDALGTWEGTDPLTGFDLLRLPNGRTLKIADLVDDDPVKRDRVVSALKNPAEKDNRDHVDIIIALGMAKEGFDWIWCEHALTIGYRSSLTEIIQIIGRATRDAKGKERARFSNFIAEPDASEEAVADAVNDTLKAIAASLLMEQVLAPRFNFAPKNAGPVEGYDYGERGYDPNGNNVGFNERTGQLQIEIKGLVTPESAEAARICTEDLNEVITAFVQDKTTIERGLFDSEMVPEELTQVRMGKIVRDKYPDLSETDQEAIRQRAVAALNLTQKAKEAMNAGDGIETRGNTALIDGVRRFAMDVRELEIDLIDHINPFGEAYAILAKSMSEESLKQVAAVIAAKRINLTIEEARDLARRALKFKQERGRLPSITSPDPWEKRLAEGVAFLAKKQAEAQGG